MALAIFSALLASTVLLLLARQKGNKVTHGHRHPLVKRITLAVPLMGDYATQGIVVDCFFVGFVNPRAQADLGCVFALDYDAPAVVADSGNVALVLRAGEASGAAGPESE